MGGRRPAWQAPDRAGSRPRNIVVSSRGRPGGLIGISTDVNMAKHPARMALEVALREVVIPDLRRRGFRGSFPHFRRSLASRIDLLTFQFHSSGGSFVVEVAQCGPDGVSHSWKDVAPNKVTAWDVTGRLRLGSDPADGIADHWFVYGKPSFEVGHEEVKPAEHYRRIAEEVVALLDSQAEPYWKASAVAVEPAVRQSHDR